MVISLFSNEAEKIYFYNLLASRKFKLNQNERAVYQSEIEEAVNTCGNILKEYGKRNLIAEIDEIEQKMEPKGMLPPSASREESSYGEQISKLTDELTDVIRNVPRNISEDLEFYSKKIVNRRKRIEEALNKEKELLNLYPDADKVDYYQVFKALSTIFDIIRCYTGETIEEEKSIVSEIVFDNRQPVKGIKKAPRSLLEKANIIDLADYSKELNKPITKTNAGLFGIVDEVFSEVNSSPKNVEEVKVESIPTVESETKIDTVIKEETKVEEPKAIEPDVKEVKIEPVTQITEAELNEPVALETTIEAKDEDSFKTNTVAEEITDTTSEPEDKVVTDSKVIPFESKDTDEIVKVEAPQVEEKAEVKTEAKEDNQEPIIFEMPNDFTLADLAQAIDESNWKDVYDAIYEANKEEFDKIVNEKNDGKREGIEYNNKLFAGLNIKIPVAEEQTKEESKGLAKAA